MEYETVKVLLNVWLGSQTVANGIIYIYIHTIVLLYHHIVLYHVILFSVMFYDVKLNCTTSDHVLLSFVVFYIILSYYKILHQITSYCTVLYYGISISISI